MIKNQQSSIVSGVIAIIGFVLAVVLVAGISAAPAPKFFVCKYVGQPGVDERLQTGNNPISVSGNALPNGTQVGDSFADAQGRSFVVAEDTGQDEPECPVPENPPEEPPVDEPKEEPKEPKEETPELAPNGKPEVTPPPIVESKGNGKGE